MSATAKERKVAAYLCERWEEQLSVLVSRIVQLRHVLENRPSDDGSHEITAITEAQDSASRMQSAVHQFRSGPGKVFPTDLYTPAAAPSERTE